MLHKPDIILTSEEKLFTNESENKQIFSFVLICREMRRKKLFIYFTFSMRFRMYYLLSFQFCWKEFSWWNQEQMFEDKHFFNFLHFLSSKCDSDSASEIFSLFISQKVFCLARNSISRLNEFSFCKFFFCCFGFWINHDCNGIFCCWDLSHALKQLLNARLFSGKSPKRGGN